MDLTPSNKINTLVIYVMRNQTEDQIFFFFFFNLGFFGNYPVFAIVLLLPLKEFSSSCVQASCLFSHVVLTAQEKWVETQENEHATNVKWTGKSEEGIKRRQRQRAENILETDCWRPVGGSNVSLNIFKKIAHPEQSMLGKLLL